MTQWKRGTSVFYQRSKVNHVFSESRLDLNSPSFQLLKFSLNVLLHCKNVKLTFDL